jgi:hypothetical protein
MVSFGVSLKTFFSTEIDGADRKKLERVKMHLELKWRNRGKFPGTQLHKNRCCKCEIESNE